MAATQPIYDVNIAGTSGASAVYYGHTTVLTAGTPIVLGADQALTQGVRVRAALGNSGNIYVGDASVSSSNGYTLSQGESVFVPIANVHTLYVNATVNNDSVSWIAT